MTRRKPQAELAGALAGTTNLLACQYEAALAAGLIGRRDGLTPERFRASLGAIAASVAAGVTPPSDDQDLAVLADVSLPLLTRWEGHLRVGAAAWELVLSTLAQARHEVVWSVPPAAPRRRAG